VGALDIGTSSVRALLFDSEAVQVPGVEVHLPYQPKVARDGTYETDAGRLLGLVSSAVDALLQEAGTRRRKRIRAMGVSTFWHGLLAADPSGRPLTPLYLWADTRSWRQSDELRGKLDPDAVHQRTGCLIHPTYWPAKLLWLKATQPELWRRRPRWLSFWDLVHQRLFGTPLTGVSMAVAAAIGARDGFGFSAGLIDYLLNFNIATKPLLLILMGLVYAPLYYFVFRFLIRRYDLPTPGRERADMGAGGPAADLPPLIDQDMDTAPAKP